MKRLVNLTLVLGFLSVGLFSCKQEQTKEQSQEYYILNDYIERGCLYNGTIIVNEDGVTVYRTTTKKSGKMVDFFADMTYKFLDGSKSGKWKCTTQSAEIQEPTDSYQEHLSKGIPETQPQSNDPTPLATCQWCGSGFTGLGYSISDNKIISGKFLDPILVEIMLGEVDNSGDYCSRKCANEAYYAN